MDERQQKLNDTRTMIDWLEAHPNVPLPQEIDYTGLSIVALNSKDEAVMLAREFGSSKKEYRDDLLFLSKQFGTLTLKSIFFRNQVCERVVVGTEDVPEHVEPAHTRDIVEWKCDPLLESEAA